MENGAIGVSNIFPVEGNGSNVWYTTEKLAGFSALAAEANKSEIFFFARDKAKSTFPKFEFKGENNYTFYGDIWYFMFNKTLFAVMVEKSGKISEFMVKSHDTELENFKSTTKLLAMDNNVIVIVEKQVKVFQFQAYNFQKKQQFTQFKDIEDVTIAKDAGMRLFKVKGAKGKFKVFTTSPSADWNPYIEGVSRKDQLGAESFNDITFIEAHYGNVVIMANTGTHYKYFIVSLS